jgi:hypothetical protein
MAEEIRQYGNEILKKINQPTLTDDEATALPEVMDKRLIYSAIATVLNSRGATGNALNKLKATATLENIDLSAKQNKRSDILIGMVVE